MGDQIIIPCLGRPMTVGTLYNCRKDTPIPGRTLWDAKSLRENSDIQFHRNSNLDVTADDSLENKTHSLNVEAEVKLSFFSGMLNVEGAAKYLDNNRSSAYQARVVLKYSCKTNTETLTMDHLIMENIKYPSVFDDDEVTHVVTAIEYGADAIFVFDKREGSFESCREVEGKLKVTLANIPVLKMTNVEGAGYVQMNEDERRLANSFTCTFHGDVMLERNPTTFEDAMEVYRELPELIRKSTNNRGIFGVPKKAYLYPLSKLDNKAARLVHSISNNIVCETESILNHIVYMLAIANDLENSDVCQKFSKLKQQIVKFKSLVSQFKSNFQRILCEMLPEIRGGGMEETRLLEELRKIKNSPYDITKLETWLEMRKYEFACLESYLEALEQFNSAFQPGELQRFTQNDKFNYVLCFSFGNIAKSGNMFLGMMENYFLNKDTNVYNSTEACEESWHENYDFTGEIRNKISEFKDFAASNTDRKDVKFIIANTSSKRDESIDDCNIILFSKNSCPVIFQPPTTPGKPKMEWNAENQITISWTPPISGAEHVIFYNILYRTIDDADEKWLHVETKTPESIFTVRKLTSGCEYLFKIEAVSEPGKSSTGPETSLGTMLSPLSDVPTDANQQLTFSLIERDLSFIQQGNRNETIANFNKKCQSTSEKVMMLYHCPQAILYIQKLNLLYVYNPDTSLVTDEMPRKGFKRFRTPDSFVKSINELSLNMRTAFQSADHSMYEIQILLSELPHYFESILEFVDQTEDWEVGKIIDQTIQKVESNSIKYTEALDHTKQIIYDILLDIQELLSALNTKYRNTPNLGEPIDNLMESIQYLKEVDIHWNEFLNFFDRINTVAKTELSANINTFVRSIKKPSLDKSMLRAVFQATGYCTQISGYMNVYTEISHKYVMPIFIEIGNIFHLTEQGVIEKQSTFEEELNETKDNVETFIKQKQKDNCEYTRKQMNSYAEKLLRILSGKVKDNIVQPLSRMSISSQCFSYD